MINYETKDWVLKSLVESGETRLTITFIGYSEPLKLSPDELRLILNQFNELGLIEGSTFKGGMGVWLTANIFDLYNHGGFTATEELLKMNIEKLLLEVESLKPSMPEKVERITSISSNIASALGFIISSAIR